MSMKMSMKKIDRLIITISIGIFLISMTFVATTVRRQQIEKANVLVQDNKILRRDMDHIFIWKNTMRTRWTY